MDNKYKSGPKTPITDYEYFAIRRQPMVDIFYPGDLPGTDTNYRLSKSIGLKFVSTLKDNNYTQTLNGLSTGTNAVCAVGVLAKVMGFPIDGNCYQKVIAVVGRPLVTKLFKLNDGEKLSLKQIGLWVEKNVEFY